MAIQPTEHIQPTEPTKAVGGRYPEPTITDRQIEAARVRYERNAARGNTAPLRPAAVAAPLRARR